MTGTASSDHNRPTTREIKIRITQDTYDRWEKARTASGEPNMRAFVARAVETMIDRLDATATPNDRAWITRLPEDLRPVADYYLPKAGQGTTKARQAVTALGIIWTNWLTARKPYDARVDLIDRHDNDAPDAANWLAKEEAYAEEPTPDWTDKDYSIALLALAEDVLRYDYLAGKDGQAADGDVHNCSGPYSPVLDPL